MHYLKTQQYTYLAGEINALYHEAAVKAGISDSIQNILYVIYEKGYYKTHAYKDSFTCKVCGRPVVSAGAGSDHRNHCPNCLSSLHLDIEPGDRQSDCGGIMDPVGVWVRKNGEWAIIHRCRRCGHLSSNRVAADDNPMKLMSIAMKPLSQPPFPLERIEEMTALMGGDGCLYRSAK